MPQLRGRLGAALPTTLLSTLATILLALLTLGGVVVLASPPASAQVLGPGTPTIPGFSGYVLSDNGELGIGRLPDGTYGVCTDTGGEFPWPADPTRTMVTNPRTAYALATYVEPARSDGRLAAALWWAVGADFAQNSHQDRVLAHVAQLHAEAPGVWADVKALHDAIVADATAHAAPVNGYRVAIKVVEGAVQQVGVRGADDWLAGYPVTLQINGPATFDASGAGSWSGSTRDQPRTLQWSRTGPGKVVVKATVSGLPSRQYERWWGGGNTQRVLAAAARVSVTDVDATGAGQQLLPLRVVKAAQDGDPAGLAGVAIEVRVDDPAGAVVDAHTFTAADLLPDGTAGVTFGPSPAGCTQGCRYDPDHLYYVVVTHEPDGWVPTATVVQARLDDDATSLVARLDDLRVFTPALVTQVSAQEAVAGATLHDVVTVSGTGGYAVPAHWALLGPVAATASAATPTSWSCAGVDWTGAVLVASGDFLAAGDGDYVVGEHQVVEPGCYTYVESADATPQTHAVPTTPPGLAAETSLVTRQPSLATQVSAQQVSIGASLVDAVEVTGTGGATVAGQWRLLGPLTPRSSDCQGLDWSQAPTAGEGVFTAAGDGTYPVGETTVSRSGCYTYVESLAPSATTRPVAWTAPGLVSETSLASGVPQLVTRVSRQRVEVGAIIHDTVTVSGTDGAQVTGGWRLLGPLPAREGGARPTCAGLRWGKAPEAASGTFTLTGDGDRRLGEFKVRVAGCYTYVETLAPTLTTAPVPETRPGIHAETTLAVALPAATPPAPVVTPAPAATPLIEAGGVRPAARPGSGGPPVGVLFPAWAVAIGALVLRRGRRR